MIDIKVKKGRGDRPMGIVQVENLTTEEEAFLYGKFEVNKSSTQVKNIDIGTDAFKVVNPHDHVTLKSSKRGWTGESVFASGISYVINEDNFLILNINGESYLPFEDDVATVPPSYILREAGAFLLLEDGSYVLQEDGAFKLSIEGDGGTSFDYMLRESGEKFVREF